MGKRSWLAEENDVNTDADEFTVREQHLAEFAATQLLPVGVDPELQGNGFEFIPVDDIALDPVTDVRSGSESEESQREFADKIGVEGLAQPILVRPPVLRSEGGSLVDTGHRIIAGRRRLAAFKRLGRARIPAYVVDVDDVQARKLAFEENYRRKQFSPVDLAKLFITSRDWMADSKGKVPANWSERVSKQFGVSRATVTEHVKMYEALAGEPSLLAKVASGELSADAAMTIASQKADSTNVFLEAQSIAVAEEIAKKASKPVKNVIEGTKRAKDRQAAGRAPEVVGVGQPGYKPADKPAEGKKPAPKPVKVQAKHVRKVLQAKGKSTGALNKAEIIDGLAKLANKPGYPAVMSAFLNYATTDWKDGKGSQEVLAQHWLAIACEVEPLTPGCKEQATGPKLFVGDLWSGEIEKLKGAKKKKAKKPAAKPAAKKKIVKPAKPPKQSPPPAKTRKK